MQLLGTYLTPYLVPETLLNLSSSPFICLCLTHMLLVVLDHFSGTQMTFFILIVCINVYIIICIMISAIIAQGKPR